MARQTDALATVYARSLFELATEAGGKDKILEVADELEQIADLARADQSFREFLQSPIIDEQKRSESLKQIFSNKVTDLTLRFLLVLNEKGRLGHLEGIAEGFDRLVQDEFGRVEVDVYTAAPIDEEGLAGIREQVQGALNREPVLHPYVDPALIGGITLRIGDQLIDGSVRTKLRRLRESMHLTGSRLIRDRFEQIIDDRLGTMEDEAG